MKRYKQIKAITQLVGVLACSYALGQGIVDPWLPLSIIAAIILGPEYVESEIADGGK